MGKKRRAIDSAEVKDPRCAALAGSSKMGIRFLRSHVSSARAHRCRTDGENGFRVVVVVVVVCLFDKPRHVGIGRYILSNGIVILRTCIYAPDLRAEHLSIRRNHSSRTTDPNYQSPSLSDYYVAQAAEPQYLLRTGYLRIYIYVFLKQQ